MFHQDVLVHLQKQISFYYLHVQLKKTETFKEKKIYSYNFQFTFVTVIKKHEFCAYDSHKISRRNTSCEHVRGKYSKSSFKYAFVHGK